MHLKTNVENRTTYTLEFCKLINYTCNQIHFIDAFNIFQAKLRDEFEGMGFVSINSTLDTLSVYKKINTKLYENNVCLFPELDKIALYEWIFREHKYSGNNDIQNATIQLKLDVDKNLTQINKTSHSSSNKIFKNPNIKLIASWKAPLEEFKRLHYLFKDKLITNSWFNLNFKDLQFIQSRMEKYSS